MWQVHNESMTVLESDVRRVALHLEDSPVLDDVLSTLENIATFS